MDDSIFYMVADWRVFLVSVLLALIPLACVLYCLYCLAEDR